MRTKLLTSTATRALVVFFVIFFLVYNYSGSRDGWDETSAGAVAGGSGVGGKVAAPPVRPGRGSGTGTGTGLGEGGKRIGKPERVGGEKAVVDGEREEREKGAGKGGAKGEGEMPLVDEDHDDADRPVVKPPSGVEGVLKHQPVSYAEYEEMDPKHFPPWSDYKDKDYDPNRWHFFDVDAGLFTSTVKGEGEGVSRTKVRVEVEPDEGKPCVGPRGNVLRESAGDEVFGYEFDPREFPQPFFGSYEAMGLNDSVCYDRISRMQAYGLSDSNDPSKELEKLDVPDAHDWGKVEWGKLQRQCVSENKGRFKVRPNAGIDKKDFLRGDDMKKGVREERGKISRTAVVLRTWEGYHYEWNDIHSIRSLVAELSLAGRGEYEVFILLHVKDTNIDIRGSEDAAHEIIENNIPPEFRDMVVVFNEIDLQQLYPNIGSNDVYQHQFQPLQYFAIHHPEYDYVWNWEMDARYIGHHLPFLRDITSFAKAQPRLYLWERSTRYFLPAVHRTWSAFTSLITRLVPIQLTTWGPVPSTHQPLQPLLAPGPIIEPDYKEWGINEQADFITLLPLFDPQNTLWAPRDRTFNFDQHLTTPRRAFINTLTRLSTRLLHAMHLENKAGRGMVSEMWPSSVALHYGLKVVYAPHPIFSTRKWDAKYADEIFNPGPDVAPGTGPDSPYAVDREHNFGGMSWYYDGGAAGTIYRRWLGWDVRGPEGKETVGDVKAQWEKIKGKEGQEERLCLPPMLLHPVKDVSFEGREAWNGKE